MLVSILHNWWKKLKNVRAKFTKLVRKIKIIIKSRVYGGNITEKP